MYLLLWGSLRLAPIDVLVMSCRNLLCVVVAVLFLNESDAFVQLRMPSVGHLITCIAREMVVNV